MAKFPKGFAFSLIKLWRKQRLAGYGLFTINDHVEWKKKRKIYDPLFGRNHIYSLLTPFNKVSKEFLIDELKSQADGTTSVDMKKIFSFITLQIINIVAFGMDLFNDEYVTSLIRPNDLLFLVNNSLEGVMIEFNNPFISVSLFLNLFACVMCTVAKIIKFTVPILHIGKSLLSSHEILYIRIFLFSLVL
jgi:hypothetical protein